MTTNSRRMGQTRYTHRWFYKKNYWHFVEYDVLEQDINPLLKIIQQSENTRLIICKKNIWRTDGTSDIKFLSRNFVKGEVVEVLGATVEITGTELYFCYVNTLSGALNFENAQLSEDHIGNYRGRKTISKLAIALYGKKVRKSNNVKTLFLD